MPEPKRPLKVFLCHASIDKSKVRELYRYLKRRGIRPWFDEVDLIGGQDWQVEIPKELATSDAIIICLTKNSVDKEGYIQREIKFALDKALEMPEGRIFLIPVKFEECEIPFSLSRYQWVDLTIEAGYSKMMKALKFRASQLERTTVELPKKTVEKKREEYKPNIIGIIGFVVLVLVSMFGLPPLIGQLPRTLTATNTEIFTPAPVSKTQIATSIITLTPLPIEIADAKGVSMVLVPAGNFNMGGNTAEMLLGCQKYYSDCQSSVPSVGDTALQVYVEEFYIDKYEVKNSDYKICVDMGVCMTPQKTRSYSRSSYYGNPEFNNYPVIYVDWVMSKTYCEWRDARLPTEAEWEKAARGTNGLKFPWGEGIDCTKANYAQDTYCVGDTTSVGNYPDGKSIYGAYDMAGNVWEWVSSLGIHYPYDVNDGREDLNPTLGPRILRGGAWSNYDFFLSSSYRGYYFPEFGYSYGFRCASSIP